MTFAVLAPLSMEKYSPVLINAVAASELASSGAAVVFELLSLSLAVVASSRSSSEADRSETLWLSHDLDSQLV